MIEIYLFKTLEYFINHSSIINQLFSWKTINISYKSQVNHINVINEQNNSLFGVTIINTYYYQLFRKNVDVS